MENSLYSAMLKGYPDVLNIKQVSEILNISKKTVYKQINESSLHSIKVGREFRIPKVSLIDYLCGKDKDGKK